MSGYGSKSKTDSSTRELTPEEVARYFGQIDQLSGGRLDRFAKNGTAATPYTGGGYTAGGYTGGRYTAARAGDIKALGGLGATQLAGIESERKRESAENTADPSLSIFQRQRADQLTDEDLDARAQAIRKETEAQIGALAAGEAARRTDFSTGEAARRTDFSAAEGGRRTAFDSEEARRHYETGAANRRLQADDLALLAEIFYGGKGSESRSKSRSYSGGGGVG